MTDRARTTTGLTSTIDAAEGKALDRLPDRRPAGIQREPGRRPWVSWPAVWRAIRPVLGWICIAIGLLGVVLPIFPGMPFLVPESRWSAGATA